jgi:uncharacterized membrane protein YraQ (UPF0718 family)
MIDVLSREFTYLWYYFTVLFEQIFKYWVIGILLGSAVSVFCKEKIHSVFIGMKNSRWGLLGIIPASLLGIASPLCMYGTIPIAASFSRQGMRDDWLAAFMMSSILLNPQLLIYSMALGKTAVLIRFLSCLICGIAAGLCIRVFYWKKSFFDFAGFGDVTNRDTDPNVLIRFLKNVGRNIKATAGYFLIGIILSVLFQRYIPAESFAGLFGRDQRFGILMASTIGVPLYVCGGGTIPLLVEWLDAGMSMGSAAAFMITGPSTKITNLGALKAILGLKQFIIYLLFVVIFAVITGTICNLVY